MKKQRVRRWRILQRGVNPHRVEQMYHLRCSGRCPAQRLTLRMFRPPAITLTGRREMILHDNDHPGHSIRWSVFLALLPLFWLAGCANTAEKEASLLVLAEPQQPAEIRSAELEPGVEVFYFLDFFRHTGQMLKNEELVRKMGAPGPPISQLNHRFAGSRVFDSGEEKGVGMIMYGFFHLAEPGDYAFQAFTNDGFELTVNGHLIISDPGVHKGRFSDQGRITAARGGWFPMEIRYFQRKGTAALELYWQPPGADGFSIVPTEIYAHLPAASLRPEKH